MGVVTGNRLINLTNSRYYQLQLPCSVSSNILHSKIDWFIWQVFLQSIYSWWILVRTRQILIQACLILLLRWRILVQTWQSLLQQWLTLLPMGRSQLQRWLICSCKSSPSYSSIAPLKMDLLLLRWGHCYSDHYCSGHCWDEYYCGHPLHDFSHQPLHVQLDPRFVEDSNINYIMLNT